MFGLFEKKIALTELLKGAKDIHNHLLPGIDDGSPNLQSSIELINMYKDLGITEMYATPHTMADYYPNTPDTINTSLAKLKEALIQNNLGEIKIKAASEYMVDPYFDKIIENDEILTLKDKHVLIEMSYLRESPNFDEAVYKLQLKGYKPILAHPERYLFYIDDDTIFTQMKNKGIKLQLNALSLSKYYGEKINKKAKELLKEGLYDFIGLDTHKTRHLTVLNRIQIPEKTAKTVKELIKNNEALF